MNDKNNSTKQHDNTNYDISNIGNCIETKKDNNITIKDEQIIQDSARTSERALLPSPDIQHRDNS